MRLKNNYTPIIMKKLFLSLLTVLLPLVAFAEVEIDGIYYNLDSNTKEAEVTCGRNQYSGSVAVIPASVTYDGVEYSVTSIGDNAFNDCRLLTSVTIPDGVKSIGKDAFFACYSLSSVNLPDGLTSIGDSGFGGCSSLSSFTVPDGIKSIGDFAFEKCYSLSSITFPNSLTKIGDNVFQACKSLTSITVPNSVKSIGEGAFCHCDSLTMVSIGNSINEIGGGAFLECPVLADFYCLAENVPSTHYEAFLDSPIENTTLHVPAVSVDAYKAAVPWKNFKEVVPLDEQSIGNLQSASPAARIDIYSIDGKFLGSAADQSEAASVVNHLPSGTTAIVKIGEKSEKVLVK